MYHLLSQQERKDLFNTQEIVKKVLYEFEYLF